MATAGVRHGVKAFAFITIETLTSFVRCPGDGARCKRRIHVEARGDLLIVNRPSCLTV